MLRNQMAYGLVCVVLLMAGSNVDGYGRYGDTEYQPRKSGSNPLQMMRAEYADILPRYNGLKKQLESIQEDYAALVKSEMKTFQDEENEFQKNAMKQTVEKLL